MKKSRNVKCSAFLQNGFQGFPNFQWGDSGGVQFSMGIGVFPISFFASFFNTGFGERRPDPRKNFVSKNKATNEAMLMAIDASMFDQSSRIISNIHLSFCI